MEPGEYSRWIADSILKASEKEKVNGKKKEGPQEGEQEE